jgi:transposase
VSSAAGRNKWIQPGIPLKHKSGIFRFITTAMQNQEDPTMRNITIALDIAKEKIHIFGVDRTRAIVIDKLVSRKKLMSQLANLQPADIFMESCAGSNWLCRQLNEMGHLARRISGQHVKPYASHQKNDRNDAKAILEACRRPGVLFVAVKNPWQQELQFLHKIRDRKLKTYKALNSQVRGFLYEFGIYIPETTARFFKAVPEVLEDGENSLSGLLRDEIRELFMECRQAWEKARQMEKKISDYCKGHQFFERAMEELPGVGPLVASRYLAMVGAPSEFKNGRQVSALLGLVPRQHSSGGRTTLGRITKNGDVGLRTMVIQGARAMLASLSRREHLSIEQIKLKNWVDRKGFNVAAVALANRNTRRMWAIMNKCA